jgi:DNA-binding PadR family transcriptional regulator
MVPKDVFQQYDEMRCGLADEVLFSINVTMATTLVETIVKRIQKIDIDVLDLIRKVGPTYYTKIKDSVQGDIAEALIRLKSRGLLVPRREESGYYKYDITELGFSVLDQNETNKNRKS